VCRERRLEGLGAHDSRVVPRRAGDVRDAAPAGLQQVLDGGPRARGLVADHRAVRRIRRRSEGVDHRDRQVVGQRRASVGAPPGHYQTVDATAEEGAHVVLLADRVLATLAHERGHLARPERVLGAAHQRDAEAAVVVGGDQPDGVRPSRQQAARDGVGLEAELLGRRADALARLLAELPPAVQRLRCGAHRHAGERGDVTDAGRGTARSSSVSLVSVLTVHPRDRTLQPRQSCG
jgi:hypothetical protein